MRHGSSVGRPSAGALHSDGIYVAQHELRHLRATSRFEAVQHDVSMKQCAKSAAKHHAISTRGVQLLTRVIITSLQCRLQI